MSIIKIALIIISGIITAVFINNFYSSIKPKKKIVFVYAANTDYHVTTHSEFTKAIKKMCPTISVTSLCASDIKNKLSVDSVCEKALTIEDASCLVVVGKIMSQVLVNIAKKRKSNSSIIFIGVDKPVEFELVKRLDHPGGNVTGVFTAELDPSLSARLIHLTVGDMYTPALIPFYYSNDTGRATEERAQATKDYLESKNIRATIMPLDSIAEGLQKIEGVLQNYKMLITLEADTLSETCMASLIKLSEKYAIPITATILNPNVLLYYAVNPKYVAETAVDLVKKIVYDHRHPSTLPVVRLSSTREFVINTSKAAELGIPINTEHIIHTINTDPHFEVVRNRVRIQ